MRFTLKVGNVEKSKIEFSRNPWTGAMQLLVDGKRVARRSPFSPFTHFALSKKWRHEFSVGRTEIHKIVLEKERPWFIAGFRPQMYRVFVDGNLIHEQSGY